MKANEVSSRSESRCEGSMALVAFLIVSIFVLGSVITFAIGANQGFQPINKDAWPIIVAAVIFVLVSIARSKMSRRI